MERPYVVVQVAASLDGRISFGPNRTQWEDIGDARQAALADQGLWEKVAADIKATRRPQAELLGSASLVKEGQPLRELPPFEGDIQPLYRDFLPAQAVDRPNPEGWLVVVDGRGRLRSGYKGDGELEWHMLHLVSHGVAPEYLAFLQGRGIPYLIAGEQQVDLPLALAKLRSQLGVTTLLTTAGGRLGGVMARAGLIDEIHVLFRPVIMGGSTTPSLFDSPELGDQEWPARLKLVASHVQGDQVWLRYLVERPAQTG